MRRLTSLAALLVVSGCRFDPSVPSGTTVSCGSDADCPTGLVCQLGAHRCVRAGSLDATPPDVVQGSVALTLTGAAGSTVAQPVALPAQGTATLRFSVTEVLAKAPVLHPPAGLGCVLVEASAQSFGFLCALSATQAREETLSGFTVDLEDPSGNASVVPLTVAVPIDTLPPAEPSVALPGQVLFRRAPYGDTDGGAPSFVVVGQPGAVAGASSLEVLVGTRVLGSGPVAADGSFRVELLPVATPFVSVRAADGAGNTSSAVAVRDGEWVITPGGRVVGQPVPNPHRLATWGALGAALPQGLVAEVGAADGLAAVDGVGVRVEGLATWRPLSAVGQRPVGGPGLMALDAARGRLVSVGYFTSLAEYDDLGWHPITVLDPEGDGNPLPNRRAASTWDPATGLTLSFANEFEIPSRLWGWNGSSWKRLADGPPTRRQPVFVHDGRRVMLFGGTTVDGGAFDDVWEYRDAQWTQLDAGAALPPARGGAAAARDPHSGLVFIFSGAGADGGLLDDFWSWDGRAFAPVAARGPSPRASAGFTCEFSGRCWLYGGHFADGGLTDELWGWDGGAFWLASTDAGPPSSDQVVLVHHPTTGDTALLTNGLTTSPFTTWLWNGSTWRKDPRERPTAVDTTGAGALFGCAYPDGPCMLWSGPNTSWLDETGWRDAGIVTPSPSNIGAVAWDAPRGSFARLGYVDDGGAVPLWWSSLPADGGPWSTSGGWPTAPLDEVFAAGTGSGVYACNYSGDVFTFDGGLWVMAPAQIPGCSSAATQPDGGVLFASTGLTSLTSAGFSSLSGPADYVRAMAFEPRTSRLVAFGGNGLDSYTPVDGGWPTLRVADVEGRGLPRMLLPGHLKGRVIGFEPPSQLWQLDWAEARPGVQWSVLWADAQLPDDAVLLSARVTAQAGGLGEVQGALGPGASVRAFVGGRWVESAPNAAPAEFPQPVSLALTDAPTLRELREEGPWLQLELAPAGPNGAGTATVQVDALELVVRYRLP